MVINIVLAEGDDNTFYPIRIRYSGYVMNTNKIGHFV